MDLFHNAKYYKAEKVSMMSAISTMPFYQQGILVRTEAIEKVKQLQNTV